MSSDPAWRLMCMSDIAHLDAAAVRLGELHQIGRPLLLVNVWDAAGARAVVAAGSSAVATSSVAMAAARGGSDGNRDQQAAFAQLRQITAGVEVPVTADRLLGAEPRADYLAAIRAAADHRGVGIVLNARIDAIIRHPQRDPAAAMDEVVRRARLYLDAGADCVYPISLRDPALVAQLVKELDSPVNVNINPSEPLAA